MESALKTWKQVRGRCDLIDMLTRTRLGSQIVTFCLAQPSSCPCCRDNAIACEFGAFLPGCVLTGAHVGLLPIT